MGLLGTILSILPTVVGVVGNLFGAKSNDYIKFSMRRSSSADDGWEDNVYFKKDEHGKMICHNGCSFPIHFSMESKNSLNGNTGSDVVIGQCDSADVTEMIANHSAKNVGRIRISANVQPHSEDNAAEENVIAVTCKGRLDHEVQVPVQMSKYISMKQDGKDITVIVHSGCVVREISSFSVVGEGDEPEHLYENLTPENVAFGINGPVIKQDSNEATTFVFKDAAEPFIYSDVLMVEAVFLCEVSDLPERRLREGERSLRLESRDWEFLRTGRCLN